MEITQLRTLAKDFEELRKRVEAFTARLAGSEELAYTIPSASQGAAWLEAMRGEIERTTTFLIFLVREKHWEEKWKLRKEEFFFIWEY